MLKLLAPIAILAILIALVVEGDRPLPRADLVYADKTDITTLDFAKMSWMQDLRLARSLFEGLTRNDTLSRDFRPVPALAQRWDVSDDRLTYTFHLRHAARWSNGQPVVASDFIFSWRRLLLPDFAADYTGFLLHIKGARAFFDFRAAQLRDAPAALAAFPDRASRLAHAQRLWHEALAAFDALVDLHAPDDHTLVVTLEHPVPYFLDLTSFPCLYPVYPPLVQAHESLDPDSAALLADSSWTRPPTLISNGPFTLARWRFKRDLRLERNPHWWGRDQLAIDSIELLSIPDSNAQVLAFRSGALDWVSDVTVNYVADMLRDKQAFLDEHAPEVASLRAQGLDDDEIARRLPNDPRNRIHAFPAFGVYFWNFNCLPTLPDGRPNPFHDPRVRRAFSLAVDKRLLTDQIRRRWEPVANSLVPPGSIPGYTPPKGLPFDPARARALLAEAGYPDAKGLITVELYFNKDAGHDVIAQFLAKQWAQHLNVQTALKAQEISITREEIKNARYVTSRGSWYGDFGDPVTFLDLHRTGDGNNDRKYSNPAFDQLLRDAELEPDPARRLAILQRAETMIVEEECPVLPLFFYVNHYLYDAHKVSGITSHPRSEQALWRVEILGDGKGPDLPRSMERRLPAPAH